MLKKIMIRCDIEGVTGIVSYDQTEPGNVEYPFGQKMFMADLIALLEGLNEGGADEIYIYDEHYYGRNIDVGQLPENTVAICGSRLTINWKCMRLMKDLDGVRRSAMWFFAALTQSKPAV